MAARRILPELVLSAKRSVWRMHDHADEADKIFRQVRKSILEEFDNTCAFCEHPSVKYQEVHHIDDDHKNNDPLNLVCACPLCHQVFHLGLAGMKEGGELIYLPEMTQAELNQIVLLCWLVSEVDPTAIKDAEDALAFQQIYSATKSLTGQLENRRGTVQLRIKNALKSTSFPQELIDKIKISHMSPTLLSNVLMALSDEQYEQRGKLLGGIRLLPRPARFRERINHWNEEQKAVMPVAAWHKLISTSEVSAIVAFCMDEIAKLTAPAPLPAPTAG